MTAPFSADGPAGAILRAPQWDDLARHVAHRPWPLPPRPWILTQTWRELLFAHWPLAPAAVRPLLPPPLRPALDTFAGQAWVGLVPFRVTNLGPRGTPGPLRLAFPELNLRTYVSVGGKPGVWFFSLDAASLLAVVLARALVRLPYAWARMQVRAAPTGIVTYHSRRHQPGQPPATFVGSYQPSGPVVATVPGSLAHWLTARYCLYTVDRAGHLGRVEIHHVPWPLQAATAELAANTVGAAAGLALAGPPPLLHFARRLDVLTWAPERIAAAEPASPLDATL